MRRTTCEILKPLVFALVFMSAKMLFSQPWDMTAGTRLEDGAAVYRQEPSERGSAVRRISVRGVPRGLTVSCEYAADGSAEVTFSGTPAKPATYATIFLTRYADGSCRRETMRLTVADGGRKAVVAAPLDAATGTVAGTGAYACGATMRLVARPARGHVFAGWHYRDERGALQPFVPGDRLDYRLPVCAFQVRTDMPEEIFARFVPVEEDLAVSPVLAPVTAGPFVCGEEVAVPLSVTSLSRVRLAAEGLPRGLRLDSRDLTIRGKPRLPGTFSFVLKATNLSGALGTVPVSMMFLAAPGSGKRTLTVTAVLEDASGKAIDDPLAVAACSFQGTGAFRVGSNRLLKAKAAPGYVFIGWRGADGGLVDSLLSDSRRPEANLVMPDDDLMLVARFLPVAEDDLEVAAFGETIYDLALGETLAADDPVATLFAEAIDSRSYPTVTVSGLPKGLAFDPATLSLVGTPVESGYSRVALQVVNASGCDAETSVILRVDGPIVTAWKDKLTPNAGEIYEATLGVPLKYGAVKFPGEVCPACRAGHFFPSDRMTVTVSGLPDGIVADVEEGLFYGTPTRAGLYVLTVSIRYYDGKNATLSALFRVKEESHEN